MSEYDMVKRMKEARDEDVAEYGKALRKGSGCDTYAAQALQNEVKRLEAENDRLRSENRQIRGEYEQALYSLRQLVTSHS